MNCPSCNSDSTVPIGNSMWMCIICMFRWSDK